MLFFFAERSPNDSSILISRRFIILVLVLVIPIPILEMKFFIVHSRVGGLRIVLKIWYSWLPVDLSLNYRFLFLYLWG